MENKIFDIDNLKELEKELDGLKGQYEEVKMSEAQLEQLKKVMEKGKADNRREDRNMKWRKFTVSAAAVVMAFVILPNTSPSIAYAMEKLPMLGNLVKLVTWQDYEYEDERHIADISVAKLELEEYVQEDELLETEEVSNVQVKEETSSDTVRETVLQESMDEINGEIEEITNNLIAEFENNMKEEMGYHEMIVENETIPTAEGYYTVKLLCYQAQGSGYEQQFYYTIDLTTGERVELKDLFREGADYISIISENIKEQMQEQMEAEENVSYWLDEEQEEWNFQGITEETSFYLNEKGLLIICFNEGDVAPMYMGMVEFEIPKEVIADIRK